VNEATLVLSELKRISSACAPNGTPSKPMLANANVATEHLNFLAVSIVPSLVPVTRPIAGNHIVVVIASSIFAHHGAREVRFIS
jgi:hypothetical protein